MALQLRIATHSEIGLVRKNNQDSGYASPHLLVVADGMGGAAAGDLASAVAVDTIRRLDGPPGRQGAPDAPEGEHMLEVLAGALHRANDRIADLVEADYSLDGMGTTVTGTLFDGVRFGLAHIGDSRAYLLHEHRLERLTHDHSWVQSLVDDGRIKPDEAAVHPHRSLLLKVLNGQPANDPDLTMVAVVPGDRLLICSDGLCGLVEDTVIEEAMGLPDLDDALDRLVAEARAEGGLDNITVILAEVLGPDSPALPGTDPVVLGAAAERGVPDVRTRERTPAAAGTGDGPAGPDDRAGSAPGDDADADDEDGEGDALVPGLPGSGATTATEAAAPEDEERYNPQHPHRRRHGRALVLLLALVLVVGAGMGSAYAWTRTQYFVGESGDRVAIFQGLSDSLPGVSLSRVYEVQPLATSALPPYYQDRVRASIDVANLDAARQAVAELTAAARRCAGRTPTPRPSVSASTSAGTPSASASAAASRAPSPSAPSASTPSRSASSPSTGAATSSAATSPQPSSSGLPGAEAPPGAAAEC